MYFEDRKSNEKNVPFPLKRKKYCVGRIPDMPDAFRTCGKTHDWFCRDQLIWICWDHLKGSWTMKKAEKSGVKICLNQRVEIDEWPESLSSFAFFLNFCSSADLSNQSSAISFWCFSSSGTLSSPQTRNESMFRRSSLRRWENDLTYKHIRTSWKACVSGNRLVSERIARVSYFRSKTGFSATVTLMKGDLVVYRAFAGWTSTMEPISDRTSSKSWEVFKLITTFARIVLFELLVIVTSLGGFTSPFLYLLDALVPVGGASLDNSPISAFLILPNLVDIGLLLHLVFPDP